MPNSRLYEYTKTEWFDVVRKLKPQLTEQEYEAMWTEYCAQMDEHDRKMWLQ